MLSGVSIDVDDRSSSLKLVGRDLPPLDDDDDDDDVGLFVTDGENRNRLLLLSADADADADAAADADDVEEEEVIDPIVHSDIIIAVGVVQWVAPDLDDIVDIGFDENFATNSDSSSIPLTIINEAE